MYDDFKIFTNLIGSLKEKYVEKIDLDSLPDVPKYGEKVNNEEEKLNCLAVALAF